MCGEYYSEGIVCAGESPPSVIFLLFSFVENFGGVCTYFFRKGKDFLFAREAEMGGGT